MDFLASFFDKYGWEGLAFATASFLLTFFVKWGYKVLTSKIKVEAYRKLANTPIAFFPVGFSLLIWYFYTKVCSLEYSTTEILWAGVLTGVVAILFFVFFGERIENAIIECIKSDKLKKALKTPKTELDDMQKTTEMLKDMLDKMPQGTLTASAIIKDDETKPDGEEVKTEEKQEAENGTQTSETKTKSDFNITGLTDFLGKINKK